MLTFFYTFIIFDTSENTDLNTIWPKVYGYHTHCLFLCFAVCCSITISIQWKWAKNVPAWQYPSIRWSMKTLFTKVGVEELEGPEQGLGLNPTEHR